METFYLKLRDLKFIFSDRSFLLENLAANPRLATDGSQNIAFGQVDIEKKSHKDRNLFLRWRLGSSSSHRARMSITRAELITLQYDLW